MLIKNRFITVERDIFIMAKRHLLLKFVPNVSTELIFYGGNGKGIF